MDRARARRLRLRRWKRWLAAGLCTMVSLGGTGCAGKTMAQITAPQETFVKSVPATAHTCSALQQVAHHTPAANKTLAITLDTVFRLAEEHNPRIGLAREKLRESQLQQQASCQGWLPNLYAGLAYYRHEGGIQDFTGRLLHSSMQALSPSLTLQSEWDLRENAFRQLDAERRVWQQKAELTQINSEILLEAATTYIDLLTARRGEAIVRQLQRDEDEIIQRVEKQAETEKALRAGVEQLRSQRAGRQLVIARLRQQGDAASAKLVYLLGLPPETCLEPIDPLLGPIELVDVTPSTEELVKLAQSNGPGVRELEGILRVIEMGLAQSQGLHNYLPCVQFNLFEGPFAAGPGANLAWDNRLDIGVQLRWNVTEMLQAEQKRQLARSRQQQAMLNYKELQGKLAAGVQASRSSILAGREQIGLAISQIRHASEGLKLSERRWKEGIGNSLSEVILALRTVDQAHLAHLHALSEHNKAQIRLLLLLGPSTKPAAGTTEPPELLPPPTNP
jgi:outer membrane protein TolC